MEWEWKGKKTNVMRISRQPSPILIMTNKKLPENIEYFSYLGSIITNDARETESRIDMAKQPFNTRKTLVTSKLDLNVRKKIMKCHIWSIALYYEETLDISDSRSKYLESFEMWCWRRIKNISWNDHVRNEEVLQRVKERRNILQTVKRRKAYMDGSHLA